MPAPLRIGVDAVQPVGGLNVAGLPVYTLRNLATGELERTTDPGRALITGRWKDIGRFKGPTLRGVAARAPYFHNGSADRLEDVIAFYDARFQIGLTEQEKADLLAFLAALSSRPPARCPRAPPAQGARRPGSMPGAAQRPESSAPSEPSCKSRCIPLASLRRTAPLASSRGPAATR